MRKDTAATRHTPKQTAKSLLGQNLGEYFVVLVHFTFLHVLNQQIKRIDKCLNGSNHSSSRKNENPAMVFIERATWNEYSVSKVELFTVRTKNTFEGCSEETSVSFLSQAPDL
jgi:hypothetical protein